MDFTELQKDIETEANHNVKDFQELKKRKVTEVIAGEWSYSNQSKKKERPGSDE